MRRNRQQKQHRSQRNIERVRTNIPETISDNLKSVVSGRYNVTEKLPSEQKRKLKIQQQRENTNELNKTITNNDSEVQNFLASGKS